MIDRREKCPRCWVLLGFAALLGTLSCSHRAQPAPPAAPTKAQAGARTDARYFGDVARAAELAGGSPLELLASGAGIPGDSLSAVVVVPPGRCALLAARGTAQVEDIDLYLFADDGDELATSDDVERPATLLYCAEEALVRLLVVARIAAGRGAYALGLFDAPKDQRSELEERALPLGSAEAGRLEDWPGLDAALGAHRELLGGQWRDVRRVIVPTDHRLPTQLDFEIEPQRCVDAFALPSRDVDDVDFEALSPSGRILARAEARGSERALLLCAGADPAKATLRLRPHAGRGAVLIALSETTGSSGRRNLHPEFPRYDLSPAPGPLPKPAPSAKRLELAIDDLATSPLGWTGCQRVELEPHYPLLGYHFVAYAGDGRLIAEHDATGPAVLHLCLPRSGGSAGRMDLRATSRGGPLDVRSLAETAPASPTLERFPLAASRLLALAADLGFLREIRDIGQVSSHELGPDQLVRIPLLVPAARCLTVLAAVDRSGPGLELAIVSARTARFSDFSRARTAVSARICADQGQTEDIVVELRAPHGQTPALVATRQAELVRAELEQAEPESAEHQPAALRPPSAVLPR